MFKSIFIIFKTIGTCLSPEIRSLEERQNAGRVSMFFLVCGIACLVWGTWYWWWWELPYYSSSYYAGRNFGDQIMGFLGEVTSIFFAIGLPLTLGTYLLRRPLVLYRRQNPQ